MLLSQFNRSDIKSHRDDKERSLAKPSIETDGFVNTNITRSACRPVLYLTN
ncbi:hypothetical protein [Microcoleus sp. bin38.metabat.b11b12b14.051]|uniref:hypothetical protein n=1 Tax=Microcoleus sp. bin38.metabat.b11b12b14.051 TaxID=2742709 RepID=UPI0025D9F01B|nr:hypothetical protein [Microcoleus sp. bin38.metabat.b11b12b14.051]